MDLNQKEIVVSQGNVPLWKNIIAALLYTTSFVLLFMFVKNVSVFNQTTREIKRTGGLLNLAVFAFISGLKLSLTKTIFINIEGQKLKTQYNVGIISFKYYSKIPYLEYVSVFKPPHKDFFEVNLWYKGNKHFNVANYGEFQSAFDFGMLFSNKLNIDLLDATEKGDFKWIDKSAFKSNVLMD